MHQASSPYRPFAFALLVIIGLTSCDEDPAVIFDPDEAGAPPPTINAVDPPDEAVGGITRITITGSNYSSAPGYTTVYFNNAKAELLSATESELVVVPPVLVGAAITLSVVVSGAFEPARYDRPYKLEIADEPYGNLARVRAIAMDSDENLYAAPPNRLQIVQVNQIPSDYATLSFTTASQLRLGPGGYVYAQRRRNIRLYRIPPGGGEDEEYARWPELAVSFDFAPSGHIYGGGDGLMVMNADGSNARVVANYDNVQTVRVFSGAVYVGITGTQPGVYRNPIQDDQGNVGTNELVFDWRTADSAFAEADVSDITFDAGGRLFIAAAGKDEDPILVVDPDGTSEALFPGVLKFPVVNFVWGNGIYLYANHDLPTGVSRINTGVNGAPYYGR